MITGMIPATGGEDIRSHLHTDRIAAHSILDIANTINAALLDPMHDYSPLVCLPPFFDNSEVLIVSLSEVYKALLGLNPRKVGGPDGINNWRLREYADFLIFPVHDNLNSSFAEQKLPRSWKDAGIIPLIKVKPVTIIATLVLVSRGLCCSQSRKPCGLGGD